jgi:HupE / UreJ protein
MRRLACGLLVLALAGAAQAHRRGESYSDWTLDAQGAQVSARVAQLELTRMQLTPSQPDYAARTGELLAARLQLWAGDAPCVPGTVIAHAGADGWVTARWPLACAGPGARAVRSTLLVDVAPSHLHLARARLPDGSVREQVLTQGGPALELGEPPDPAASLARYVALGFGHILSGRDHVAFVLALILLAARLREVVLLATAFTAAHSLTLAAAVLGWAQVRSDAVEAVIGFSIALVAAENLWLRGGRERWLPVLAVATLALLALVGATRLQGVLLLGLALFTACYFALVRQAPQPFRLRAAVAFVFGLAHGFGFAGALLPLQLPPERIAAGLFGFNLGVELGQLAVVAVAWPVLAALRRRPLAFQWSSDVASACICALGTFWFVMRSFG